MWQLPALGVYLTDTTRNTCFNGTVGAPVFLSTISSKTDKCVNNSMVDNHSTDIIILCAVKKQVVLFIRRHSSSRPDKVSPTYGGKTSQIHYFFNCDPNSCSFTITVTEYVICLKQFVATTPNCFKEIKLHVINLMDRKTRRNMELRGFVTTITTWDVFFSSSQQSFFFMKCTKGKYPIVYDSY